MAAQTGSNSAAAVATQEIHTDTTVKWFLLGAVGYFAIVGIVALIIAAKFVWPQFLGSISYFTYGRMRPLHVNGMLFGWLLAADMGLAYYIVPRLCGVKLWSEKLGVATSILWNIIILSAVVTLLGGYQKGLEYADLPTPVAILVVIAWVMFGINIFATVATRKYEQMYVSTWYLMGTILWTAFVYLTGNFATLLPGITGVNQANLNWMYTHNAVGLIFTPAGLAAAYYFIPRASNTPLFSHRLSMVGFWSLAFVYVWTGAHHMIHGPISQWLQTISIVFSIMLLIPVWAVVYNFIRDRCTVCVRSTPSSPRPIGFPAMRTWRCWAPSRSSLWRVFTMSCRVSSAPRFTLRQRPTGASGSSSSADWACSLHCGSAASGRAGSGTIPPFRSSTQWSRSSQCGLSASSRES
jgi:cbb3-type cytochrome oxidase subunit 1